MTKEEFLKNKIHEAGYSLPQYSKHINMSYSTLCSLLIRKDRKVEKSSLENISKICNGLGVNINELNNYR